MNPMLKVTGLTKSFSESVVVNDLSFTVNQGDVYGFLGQNGAGKSTTLRMLLKLIKPSSGNIFFFGKPLTDAKNTMLKQTGAVIERPDMYKYLTAYDNLRIFACMSGIRPSRAVIMDQLQSAGLVDRWDSKVKTFSQGMKQRLGIAIALIHQPALIILDEPINGLDPQGIADMRNMILHLSKDLGRTVIVSSHLLSEIELIANRMLIIHKGKKIAEGVVKELLDPAKTIVQIQTTNDIDSVLKLQGKSQTTLEQTPSGLKISMNRDDIPQLINTMIGLDISILSIKPMHSLEDYFLSLTNQQAHDVSPAN
jgi:ABC-type multidrug transport system ATPase subunit